jgi:hypothetical protein
LLLRIYDSDKTPRDDERAGEMQWAESREKSQ